MAGVTGADFDKVASVIRSDRWRESPQATKWVGKAVAQALDLDVGNKAEKARIVALLKVWLASGALVKVEGKDEERQRRTFVEVAEEA
jgi:hypothetical protein